MGGGIRRTWPTLKSSRASTTSVAAMVLSFRSKGRGWSWPLPRKKRRLAKRRSLAQRSRLPSMRREWRHPFEQFNAIALTGRLCILQWACLPMTRTEARRAPRRNGKGVDEVAGTLSLLQRLVNGEWYTESFLVVPPGATIRATLDDEVIDAQ